MGVGALSLAVGTALGESAADGLVASFDPVACRRAVPPVVFLAAAVDGAGVTAKPVFSVGEPPAAGLDEDREEATFVRGDFRGFEMVDRAVPALADLASPFDALAGADPASPVSAVATPVPAARATPTPRATASAPTRPTSFVVSTVIPFCVGAQSSSSAHTYVLSRSQASAASQYFLSRKQMCRWALPGPARRSRAGPDSSIDVVKVVVGEHHPTPAPISTLARQSSSWDSSGSGGLVRQVVSRSSRPCRLCAEVRSRRSVGIGLSDMW